MSETRGNHRHLWVTLLAGLILLIIALGALIFFYFSERSVWNGSRKQDSFSSILRDYDAAASEFFGTQREYDRLHHELDRLEKKAISVESWLSILKRRRILAKNHTPSEEIYRSSINKALKAYPKSEPVIAIAAASLVKNSAVTREIESQLRDWLPFIIEPSFNDLRLSLYVLLGDFNSPQKANALPANLYAGGTESAAVNLAILKALRGDYHGAASDIQTLLNSEPSLQAVRFAAEYNYDFGDLLRSAELFASLNTNDAMLRQADALYLAGFPQNAMAIWLILANIQNEISLYNLAVTSEDLGLAADFLDKLVNLEVLSNSDSRQFGLIRYSRLFDNAKALTLLRGNKSFSPNDYPYIDLEICKRIVQGQNPGFQIAQSWLLLDRHEKNKDLYQWVCRLFFFQRSYDEALILLNRMDQLQINEKWVDVYKALYYMVEGKLDAAEELLRPLLFQEPDWYDFANYALVLESTRTFGRALEQYKLAAENLQDNKSAARIQIHIARCFTALKRQADARQALLYALELDPDNLTASLELDRGL
ncbi:hypothetical protein [Treponema sp. R80B11-R83G3]